MVMIGSLMPFADATFWISFRRRRPAIVVNSAGTFKIKKWPTLKTEMGTELGSHLYGSDASPVFNSIGFGSWHAICSFDGCERKPPIIFQKGFDFDKEKINHRSAGRCAISIIPFQTYRIAALREIETAGPEWMQRVRFYVYVCCCCFATVSPLISPTTYSLAGAKRLRNNPEIS